MKPRTVGVVLFQLGGPDRPEAVEPFLYNLFSDPDIIDIPGAFLFRRMLARIIAARRAPRIQRLYRNIGGSSPILPQTQLQASRLRETLSKHGLDANVQIAMRYWHPMTKAAVDQLRRDGIRDVVLLPLYPHYSKATTGSSVNEWQRALQTLNGSLFSVRLVESYYNHPLYIAALIEHITRALERVPPDEHGHVHLVFSAHGTPLKLAKSGDPYSGQVRTTYELVVQQGNFGLAHHLCFQSKVGPQKWLEPSLTATIAVLAEQKVTHVLVIPIAFVTDHIETLSEINIEAREQAKRLGFKHFDMMPALIANEKFIACLADLVLKQLKN